MIALDDDDDDVDEYDDDDEDDEDDDDDACVPTIEFEDDDANTRGIQREHRGQRDAARGVHADGVLEQGERRMRGGDCGEA